MIYDRRYVKPSKGMPSFFVKYIGDHFLISNKGQDNSNQTVYLDNNSKDENLHKKSTKNIKQSVLWIKKPKSYKNAFAKNRPVLYWRLKKMKIKKHKINEITDEVLIIGE